MKRIIVKRVGTLEEIFRADEENPQSRIDDNLKTKSWGDPGQYTVEVIDVTADYKKKNREAWIATRKQKADDDVRALLGNEKEITRLMRVVYRLYVATNVSGSLNVNAINKAKQDLLADIALMNQVEAIRTQADADITAYTNANPA